MIRYNLITLSFLLLFVGLKSYSQNLNEVGQWSPPIQFEIVPVAVANLPDGRLVTWSSKYHDNFGGADGYTFTQIFDPSIGEHGGTLPSTVTDTNHDMFCPGINNLADGRLMVTGGSSDEKTSIYDPKTEVWTGAEDMNIPRGYQGAVTLSDGSIFTIGGSWNESTPDGGKDGELWTEETGWVHLTGLPGGILWNADDLSGESEGEYRLDNHAWLYAAPNGKIFHAGPGQEMHWFDVSDNGSHTSAGPNGKRGTDVMSMNGTTAMYDIGKILKVGGSRSYSKSTPSSKKSVIIDFNDENNVIVTEPNNEISKARTYVSSVVLPTGEVLILGGAGIAHVFWDGAAHLSAELFDPVSEEFRTLASMAVPRTYHSAGILLKDGRVFMGGGGLCGACTANHKDAEIFSPPYLFDANGAPAERPTLSAPENAYYNTSLPVVASEDVTEFSFIRMSSATHSINNEQRRVPVDHIEESNGKYTITMPGANLMPPGYYMLFAIKDGVPSIAETVMVGKQDSKVQEDHLLVEFDFFEGKGHLVHDTSGNDNHGTIKERDDDGTELLELTQEYWSPEGLSGNALEMDGKEHLSNSILEIPTSTSLGGITNQITVMAWVNRNTGSVVSEAGNEIPNVSIFAHDYPRSFFMGYHDSEFKVEFRTKNNGHFNAYTGVRYTPGEWEHFVSTYDGSTAKVYLNGEEIFSRPVSGDLKINTPDNATENKFTLSGFYDSRPGPVESYGNKSGITDELDGRMDKFKLYDVALTEAEILAIYNKERQDVISEGPCDDYTLSYEVNDDNRFNLRKEISVLVDDDVAFFIDDPTAEFTITNPQNVLVDGSDLQNMTVAKSGEYTINVTLKQEFTAKNLSVESVSSAQPTGQSQPALATYAIDGNPSSFWHTQWSPANELKTPPHEIVLKLEEVSQISGLEYLPRQNAKKKEDLNGTIEKYEIYVSTLPSGDWGAPVATGTWVYNDNLKTSEFTAKEGQYLRLVALQSDDPSRVWASAAEIRIKTAVITECEQTVTINVHQPQTYVYNDGWVTNNPSGESTLNDDIVIENGDALLSSPTMANTITIEPGAALLINDKDVILTATTTILNSRSDSFSSLIHNGWVTGQVHYNRYVNEMGTAELGGGNDLISSPIFGGEFDAQFVDANSNLPQNPNNPGEFAFAPYNVSSGNYENFDIGSAYTLKESIVSGQGYRAATNSGGSLVFRGAVTNNPVEISILGGTEKGLWNLIGNPYPSYLDFEMFFEANKDQFEAGDAYQAIYGYTGNSGDWTILNNLSLLDPDPNLKPIIAPGQGFFVKSKVGGGMVQFTPEMRRSGASDDFIEGRPNKNIALSKLKLTRASKTVTTSVYFLDGSTKGIDPGFDAAAYGATKVDFSLFTNLVEDNKGLNIAIQALPYNDFNDVIVPLGLKAKGGIELTISIDDLSTLPSNINVYLEDTQNNTLTYLNNQDFKFTPTQDINVSGRFNVHYSSRTLSIGDLESNDRLRIYTTAMPKTLFIKGQLAGATTAQLYDIQGRLVLSQKLNPSTTENTMDISTITTGVYVVKVNNDNQVKTQKVIIK